MLTVVTSTLHLYREALHATSLSLIRGWMAIPAVIVFTLLMLLAYQIARPLGMLGGFLLGAVNACLIGATLRVIEQAIMGMRAITIGDVIESMGHYFWDVSAWGLCSGFPPCSWIRACVRTLTVSFSSPLACCWCSFS